MAGKVIDNSLYIEDLDKIISLYDLSPLYGKTIMISGATGMIGSLIVDLLMHFNETSGTCNIRIIALGRNWKKAEVRFGSYFNSSSFLFYECDITTPLKNIDEKVDYIIHAASTTHPLAYSTEPVGTVTSNVLGTMNLLNYGTVHGLKRFIFLSSVEVYGENRGDVDRFDENYCGYINCNTLRAGYPESKRLCEALCQAYRKEKGVEIVIPRLARSFGPTMLMSDTKAISQFIKKGIAGEDIVLKSEGKQLYTYTYAADAASGIVACLLNGADGEAYNISDEANEIILKDLASLIAEECNVKVVFELPDSTEKAGYSTATKAIMDSSRIKMELGWKCIYSLNCAISRTVNILKSLYL